MAKTGRHDWNAPKNNGNRRLRRRNEANGMTNKQNWNIGLEWGAWNDWNA